MYDKWLEIIAPGLPFSSGCPLPLLCKIKKAEGTKKTKEGNANKYFWTSIYKETHMDTKTQGLSLSHDY